MRRGLGKVRPVMSSEIRGDLPRQSAGQPGDPGVGLGATGCGPTWAGPSFGAAASRSRRARKQLHRDWRDRPGRSPQLAGRTLADRPPPAHPLPECALLARPRLYRRAPSRCQRGPSPAYNPASQPYIFFGQRPPPASGPLNSPVPITPSALGFFSALPITPPFPFHDSMKRFSGKKS